MWGDRVHGLAISEISAIFRIGRAASPAAASTGCPLADLGSTCGFLPTAAAETLERLTAKPKSDLSFNGSKFVVTTLSEAALSFSLGSAVMRGAVFGVAEVDIATVIT